MRNRRGILLVRLKSIGDILFTLPSVHALRGKFPESRISFLISKEYAPLLEGFRDVNQVFELDRSRFRGLHPMKVATAGYSILRMMRRERLRLAIDLQGYGETAFLTWASGARERWGIFYRSTRTCTLGYQRGMPAFECDHRRQRGGQCLWGNQYAGQTRETDENLLHSC